ncbi:MAG: hypothetical protein R2747_09170 [Pyrinomonadaceae bacterium]
MSLFFLITLAGSIPAGTAFAGGGMNENMCRMKCCKKEKAKGAQPKKSDVAICRTLNCSTPAPTNSGSSAQVNLAPNLVISEKATLFAILFSTTPKESAARPLSFEPTARPAFQPKYIQNLSLLI